jgi:hypothetical protein
MQTRFDRAICDARQMQRDMAEAVLRLRLERIASQSASITRLRLQRRLRVSNLLLGDQLRARQFPVKSENHFWQSLSLESLESSFWITDFRQFLVATKSQLA